MPDAGIFLCHQTGSDARPLLNSYRRSCPGVAAGPPGKQNTLAANLRRPPDFLPPRPIRETAAAVPPELGRTLRGEAPLDVRAYVDESGNMTYAQMMMSNVTEAHRRLPGLAVFDARRWALMPSQLGKQRVAGR